MFYTPASQLNTRPPFSYSPSRGQCEGAFGLLDSFAAPGSCPKWVGVIQAVTFREEGKGEPATGVRQSPAGLAVPDMGLQEVSRSESPQMAAGGVGFWQ